MSNNKNLNRAKKEKNDEFYTRLEDITAEVTHYHKYLKNKVIYCNCDGEESNFWKYFISNFDNIGIKKIIATKYNSNGNGDYLEFNGKEVIKSKLNGNSDFRSPECIEILKHSDVIVTNPPFSLFRDFIDIITKYNKKFLVIGNINAVTYVNVFPLIKNGKLWLGYTSPKIFEIPNREPYISMKGIIKENNKIYKKLGNICWYTNLPVNKRNNKLTLSKYYEVNKYPKYDNYDAIEVSKVKDIPIDYTGVMGVPITFLYVYNPKQFKILGINRGIKQDSDGYYGRSTFINGKETYKRIFIKRRK